MGHLHKFRVVKIYARLRWGLQHIHPRIEGKILYTKIYHELTLNIYSNDCDHARSLMTWTTKTSVNLHKLLVI